MPGKSEALVSGTLIARGGFQVVGGGYSSAYVVSTQPRWYAPIVLG